MAVCTVCLYVDRDARQKMCFYCPVCDAEICEACQHNWGRRVVASARRIAERLSA